VTLLPHPALYASHGGIWIADSFGTRAVGRREAIAAAGETPMILLNAPLVGQRLGYPDLSGLDVLELFAFVHPARFMVPTIKGLADALSLPVPADEGAAATFLRDAAAALVAHITGDWPEREGAHMAAQTLARLKWPWARIVSGTVAPPENHDRWLFSKLPEWEETPPRPPARTIVIEPETAVARLATLTGKGAEERIGQRAYAEAAAQVFGPRPRQDAPNMLLAEAGTGIGKTLAYLAPASLWAAQAQGTVWISTFTKALQRQLDAETPKLFAEPGERARRVVVRKGRENYLCLLNLEDALQGGFSGRAAVLAQLVARWAAFSRDGDMVGGDLPGWLPTLFRRNGATALTDRRGECIFAGCPHYRRCFIERAARASQNADLVIANHALVMINAARGREASNRPTRIVFDEGHHLFDAADSVFAVALTGQEAIELRRWVIGPEGTARGRRRGLSARLGDVASYDAEGSAAIAAAIAAAQALPADGWLARIGEGSPFGPVEALLAAVRGTVYARAEQEEAGYGLETEAAALDGPIVEAAAAASVALDALVRPMVALGRRLEAVLAEPPDWLDGPARARIEGAIAALGYRRDTGAVHLPVPAQHFAAASPFDYAKAAQVLIVTDVKRGDVAALANAYARLMVASDGGTLGLFTAIRRLRGVHARIADRLARDGLPLYAQHVDPIDTGTLVDIFRDDPRASLIGTDALRDGVDVPGNSLRTVILEGVPWPRPTVLHAARRASGGGSVYDDGIVRARLAQAFGRLIRRADDRGSFVVLSAAIPSRLLDAFPPGTPILRVTLDQAVERLSAERLGAERAVAPLPSVTPLVHQPTA